MTEAEFWRLIDKSRGAFDPQRRDGNMDRQVEELRGLLTKLSTEEIRGFNRRFDDVFDRAYRWDLWGAAYVIGSGCSDDWFDYFRYWLISMGQRVYESALADPESLAEAAGGPGVEDIFFEAFSYVADEVLDERGEPPAASGRAGISAEPAGQKWTKEELPARFPRLWSAYGRR